MVRSTPATSRWNTSWVMKSDHLIKFLSWNVHGLKQKITDTTFLDYISSYDLVFEISYSVKLSMKKKFYNLGTRSPCMVSVPLA